MRASTMKSVFCKPKEVIRQKSGFRFIRSKMAVSDEVLAANMTAPYDASTLGDTKQSKERFITEVYDEVKDFPPVINGK